MTANMYFDQFFFSSPFLLLPRHLFAVSVACRMPRAMSSGRSLSICELFRVHSPLYTAMAAATKWVNHSYVFISFLVLFSICRFRSEYVFGRRRIIDIAAFVDEFVFRTFWLTHSAHVFKSDMLPNATSVKTDRDKMDATHS